MKTRDLQRLGFEPVIKKDGSLAYVLPLCSLSEAAAHTISPPQLSAIMRRKLEDGGKVVASVEGKLAKEPAP